MQRRKYRLTKPFYDTDLHAQDDAMKRQDERFMRAMVKAIAAGQERAPAIGALKDTRPSRAKRLNGGLAQRSYVGAPAHMCSDGEW